MSGLETQDESTQAPLRLPKKGVAKALLGITALFLLIALAWGAWYVLILSKRESTDNAYVGGDQYPVSAEMHGRVAILQVQEMQHVEAGQPLIELDDTDVRLALERAEADLRRTVRQVSQMRHNAEQAEAEVQARQLQMQQATSDLARREPLLDARAIAPELVAHAREQVRLAKVELRAAKLRSAAANALIGEQDPTHDPSIRTARAAYVQAWIQCQRVSILAPVDGDVVQKIVVPGQIVDPGVTLLRIVPSRHLWVDANFKETQLGALRVGQPVRVTVDAYGSKVIYGGRVRGFSAGTGAVFSLLPSENAVGNWVKVVQRLPVRIDLDPADQRQYPLRIGLSAEVKVDVHDQSGLPLSVAGSSVHAVGVTMRPMAPAGNAADRIISEELGRGV